MTTNQKLTIHAEVRLRAAETSVQFWKDEIKKLEKQKKSNQRS